MTSVKADDQPNPARKAATRKPQYPTKPHKTNSEEELRKRVTSLEADLDLATKVVASVEPLQTKIARLELEKENLRKKVSAMEAYYKIEGAEFGDLEKIEDLKKQLSASQSAIRVAHAEIQRLEEKFLASQSANDRLGAEFKKVGNELTIMAAEKSKLEARNSKGHEEFIKLRLENDEAKAVHVDMKAVYAREIDHIHPYHR